jgi:hypothetical protein
MSTPKTNLEHLEWAIQSRAKNQITSLRLLRLFEEHESTWKTSKFARAAQDLIAVSFSLWRAAFLADKTSKRADVFDMERHSFSKWSRIIPYRTLKTRNLGNGHSIITPEMHDRRSRI